MKILLIEDDNATAAVLSELLTAQFYTVDIATDGQAGLSLLAVCDYDLVLVDLLIPNLDGIALCQQLRAEGFQKPILLLTAKDSSIDVVKGLDAGADDYVTKPYNLSELMARIRALLRRKETALSPSTLNWEQLCVNLLSAEVTYAGQKVVLTPKEYSLLGLLLQNPQRIFSRSSILDRLWSIDNSPSEGTVTNLVKDLRQKLKAAGMSADLLETVHGLGYRLKAPPSADQIETTVPGPVQPRSGGQKRRGRPKKGMGAINQVIERYRHTFLDRVSLLAQIEQELRQGQTSSLTWQDTIEEAHKLAGTLGTFGYGTGSTLACQIEHLLLESTPSQIDLAQFSRLLAELKQCLLEPPLPLSDEVSKSAQIPIVTVIDHNVAFTEQLKADAFAWGMKVEVVADLSIAQQHLATSSSSAVLLNLSWQTDTPTQTLEVLQSIRADFPELPILVLTKHNRLADRVVVSRFGVQRFLHQPITTVKVFEAIAQVLPKSHPTEARVMLLDDDPIVLNTLRNLLQPWGLQVVTLQYPQQFWEVLVATKPDLLVLDIEMPEFNGIDLCRVVRQDVTWGDLPILVVTAHTDMASIQQVFAAGADDFIGKPIVGPEIVTRVISRIDRSRLQQQLKDMKQRIGK